MKKLIKTLLLFVQINYFSIKISIKTFLSIKRLMIKKIIYLTIGSSCQRSSLKNFNH